jgi:DNA primase large subunit
MRLAIVAELRANGWSQSMIVDAFSRTPDFNRRITEDNVNYSIKRNYPPFKCDTIKSLGYCIKQRCPIYKT